MKRDYGYLSDEELNKLIAEAENEGLAEAPESISEKVLAEIVTEASIQTEKDNPAGRQRNKQAEFYKFTYKVVLSVAAAILLMTVIPMSKVSPSRDEVLQGIEVKSRDEVLTEHEHNMILTAIETFINEKGGFLK